MHDNSDSGMEHEDNSIATKFGLVLSIVLLLIIVVGCLWVLWEVIKLFIYWN